MGLLDSIASMLGRGGGDGQQSVPEMLVHLLGNQDGVGGLNGLVQRFEQAGAGGVIQSWIGTGQNQPVSPDLLHTVLGSQVVQQMAAKTGLPVDQLLQQAAQHLPQVVDAVTPNGEVPQGGTGAALLQAGLAFLQRRGQAGPAPTEQA